ncbi:MAG: amino acid adenylation domain-containing protein, partial [Clostridiales bacterium]|nr:amino acid adenylation domain-containing protein [Clostridiales bacterium]
NYALSVTGYETEGKLGFDVMYDPNEYSDEEMHAVLERLVKISEEIAEKKDGLVEDIETVTEKEKNRILTDFNDTATDYPREKTVVDLFEEQVEKTPDNTAVVFEGTSLTYRELNERANILAHELRELGVRPDDMVAIKAERSLQMIVGIYGILKSGGAYVPIDPTYPEERIQFMLDDCEAKAIVLYGTEQETELAKIDLGREDWTGDRSNPEHVNKPEDLAYCIYTSGTTGQPKGVLLEHHGVVNLGRYMQTELQISQGEHVLQFANYIFDGSVWEFLLAHMNGAVLYVPMDETIKDMDRMRQYLKDNSINTSYFPPAYYEQGDFELDGYLVTAGSQTNKKIIQKAVQNSKYINSYGPTEVTICASNLIYSKNEKTSETVTIGKPISNTKIYILNKENLCGIGIPGELCIAGEGLARGYLNRPELTEEKFVKNPFGEGRMYRSGDLARWLPDGNIEYLGRIDEQVKIRGFRIELGEIESRIREIERVKDCAVIARADASGEKAIYAYYVSEEELSNSEIRDELGKTMPDYMIPSYMMRIEAIPVTRNGKLDKRALPEIEAGAGREYVAPRTETEEKICGVFSELLNIEQVG